MIANYTISDSFLDNPELISVLYILSMFLYCLMFIVFFLPGSYINN